MIKIIVEINSTPETDGTVRMNVAAKVEGASEQSSGNELALADIVYGTLNRLLNREHAEAVIRKEERDLTNAPCANAGQRTTDRLTDVLGSAGCNDSDAQPSECRECAGVC